ncbi:MAG TPA: signal peptidase I [Candidatus Nanopelagicaceae bacterium]|nr:signal peptidase I [Candidatus Nanopelagicaceae bacterium]
MKKLRRKSHAVDPLLNGSTRRRRIPRFFTALLWGFIPTLALTAVASYVGLSVVRQIYPPVVMVEGTSMNPLLHTGDLVFLKKAQVKDLHKGQIIAFRTSPNVQQLWHVPGSYVHRIVTVQKGSYGLQFQTKGDNVSGKDPFWTVQANVIGVYESKISGVAYPVLFIGSKQGKILGAGLLLILLLYWLLGIFERKNSADAVNVHHLSSIVDEARAITHKMEEIALSQLRGTHHTPTALASGDATIDKPAVDDDRETMRQLVGAIGEYGEHLQSHTAVMKGLAATTAELQGATVEMRQAIVANPRPLVITTSPPPLVAKEVKPISAEMPRLKRSLTGFSRKAVRAMHSQMAADLAHTKDLVDQLENSVIQLEGNVEQLQNHVTEISLDRDRMEQELIQARNLQESLASSLAIAEEQLKVSQIIQTHVVPTHVISANHSTNEHNESFMSSLANLALRGLARRFGLSK